MQAFFPDINPTAWMACNLCKWKPCSFPFIPHNEKNHCHHLSSLEFGFFKGFSEVHCLKTWFSEVCLAMNYRYHPFLYKMECMECLWWFWFTPVHCHEVGYTGSGVAEYCGGWAATTGRKVSCHFFWKVLWVFIIKPHVITLNSIIQSREILFY